jgi:hypothetical protein
MTDTHLDPWVAEQVDAALAPYRDRLGTEELAWMRERLIEATREDPELSRVVRGAVVREVDESGSLPRDRQDDDAGDKSA